MSLYNDDDQDESAGYEVGSDDSTNDASHGVPMPAEQAAATPPRPAEILPPEKPGFPLGWAVLGACAFAALWAASMDGKK